MERLWLLVFSSMVVLSILAGHQLVQAGDPPRREFGSIDSGLTIPHFASGDEGNNWGTEFQIFGLDEFPVPWTMQIFDSNGNLQALTLREPGGEIIGTSSFFAGVTGAGLVRMETESSGPIKQGYVLFEASFGNLAVNAIITSFDGQTPLFRTFVPGLQRFQNHIRMAFSEDRGFLTGIAYKNDANQNMTIIARDTLGNELCRKTSFIADETHRAFLLRNELPCTQGQAGLLEIVTDFVGLTAIGLTFDSDLRMWTNIPYEVCCFDVQ